MKRAFTLTELIVTIVIIGILAALAIPMFPRAIETTKAKEAVATLQQIRTGERIYRMEENDYWPHPATGDPQQDVRDISETLLRHEYALDARDNRSWNYSITTTVDPDTFIATAEREGGSNDGETITINEQGTIDKINWSP